MVYDSHCHYEAFQTNPTFNLTVIPSVTLADIEPLVALRNKYTQIKIGFGIHPWAIAEQESLPLSMQRLDAAIEKFKPDFIGEIGLDKLKPNFALQQEYFTSQVALAKIYNLPIIIHCLHAYNELMQIIEKNNFIRPNLGIIHAYNNNEIIAAKLIRMGFYLGVGALIGQQSKLSKCIKLLPPEKLVIESDAPYNKWNFERQGNTNDCFLYAQILTIKLNSHLLDMINKLNDNLQGFFKCSKNYNKLL
ncbi:MAG: TatD family hydrolase [Burkholderiales bacterium]|nr:TatD family hydrolase [Burkholderiales bacterium]